MNFRLYSARNNFSFSFVAFQVKEEILVNSSENSTAVTAIDTYDVCSSGKDDLIVGRRDGTVQVFSLPSIDSEIDTEIREIFCEVRL